MALQRQDDNPDDSDGLDDSEEEEEEEEEGETGPTAGTGVPGEETEETKASHKMAERRRRQRMGGLFDTLKDMLPMNGPQPKTSKGWVLMKGLAVFPSRFRCVCGTNFFFFFFFFFFSFFSFFFCPVAIDLITSMEGAERDDSRRRDALIKEKQKLLDQLLLLRQK